MVFSNLEELMLYAVGVANKEISDGTVTQLRVATILLVESRAKKLSEFNSWRGGGIGGLLEDLPYVV